MEQHIRLIVFEHLRHELDVHVLHVDLLKHRSVTLVLVLCFAEKHSAYLERLVQHADRFVEFLLCLAISMSLWALGRSRVQNGAYNVCYYSREQLGLLVLVWALLIDGSVMLREDEIAQQTIVCRGLEWDLDITVRMIVSAVMWFSSSRRVDAHAWRAS